MVFVGWRQRIVKVYRLNLMDEFTSLFSPKVIVAGLPRESFVDISVFLWLRKQQPRFAQGQPKGYFLTKELDRTTEAYARMNVVWEGPVCWVQCANMWQDCSLTAVQTKTAFLEQSWWPEFDTFGSMPWCSFPWHKLLPRLAQKTCHTKVWIWSMSSHPCFRGRWLLQVCLGKPSHEAGLCRHQCCSVFAQATAKIRPRPAQWIFSIERTW